MALVPNKPVDFISFSGKLLLKKLSLIINCQRGFSVCFFSSFFLPFLCEDAAPFKHVSDLN